MLRPSMLLAAATLMLGSSVLAQEPAAPASSEPQSEAQKVFNAARKAAVQGPSKVKLADQATLDLPAGYIFVPKKENDALMTAMGNTADERDLGSIWPTTEDSWFIAVSFMNEGYIKDEEAKDWDVDAMLENFKDGTEQQNRMRADRGLPEMEITGWVEKPYYDAVMHRLIWSMGSKLKGAPEGAEQGVNYNTYALGREGFISLNLVTGLNSVESQKPIAKQLLSAVTYEEGKRYTDFNAGTDKVATYGIAALVGGVAAKKLGLLAMAGVFLAKIWKLALIGLFALGGTLKKIFGKGGDKPD